ncbi:cytochrome P450 [Cubamyces lactineus]|nr:cytochrome P450 [Cubamyces lactineus]
MSNVQQLLGCLAALYVGWRILRFFVVAKSPLDNIPGPASESFISGGIEKIMDPRAAWDYQRGLVERYGRLFKIHGLFNAKWLYTYDPRALHSIFIKDQDVYEETDMLISMFNVLTGPGLIATLGSSSNNPGGSAKLRSFTIGDQHRRQRKMLNPVFSAKHLREMTPIFNAVTGRLLDAIAYRVENGTTEIDVLGWMSRTALELIGQGGLGYSFDPLTEDRADDFADSIKAFFPVASQVPAAIHQLLPWLVRVGPPSFRRKMVEMAPFGVVQRLRQITDTIHTRSIAIINEKKAALERGDEALKEQVGEGKDLMSVLLRANMSASAEDRLADDELVAQVSGLVMAAMDTTSNALSRILHQLAKHPDVQEKLREEVFLARDDGTGKLRDLDYDEVMELPYLDAVCRETLRRYPPVRGLFRIIRKDAMLPLSAPIRGLDGSLIDVVPVTKGMLIVTDIEASNCNKEIWGEDAYEWKPERWLKPLPSAIEDAHIPGVYSHLMTFIGGSRSCIGFKFSQLEMKIVLATLLPAFKFELSDKPIFWNAAGITYPSAGDYSTKPEMPLKVTMIRA